MHSHFTSLAPRGTHDHDAASAHTASVGQLRLTEWTERRSAAASCPPRRRCSCTQSTAQVDRLALPLQAHRKSLTHCSRQSRSLGQQTCTLLEFPQSSDPCMCHVLTCSTSLAHQPCSCTHIQHLSRPSAMPECFMYPLTCNTSLAHQPCLDVSCTHMQRPSRSSELYVRAEPRGFAL